MRQYADSPQVFRDRFSKIFPDAKETLNSILMGGNFPGCCLRSLPDEENFPEKSNRSTQPDVQHDIPTAYPTPSPISPPPERPRIFRIAGLKSFFTHNGKNVHTHGSRVVANNGTGWEKLYPQDKPESRKIFLDPLEWGLVVPAWEALAIGI